jgi:hypothetical protein
VGQSPFDLDNSPRQGDVKGDDDYSRHQQLAKRAEINIRDAGIAGLPVPTDKTVPTPNYYEVKGSRNHPHAPTHGPWLCSQHRTSDAESVCTIGNKFR